MTERRTMMDGFSSYHPELEKYEPNEIFTQIGLRSYIKKGNGWSIGMAALFGNNWIYPIIISDSTEGLKHIVSDKRDRDPLTTAFEFEYEDKTYYVCISYGLDNGSTVAEGYNILNTNNTRFSYTPTGKIIAAKALLEYYFYG